MNTSLFSQIIRLLPREIFHRIVKRHESNRSIKSFTTWDHLLTMLFCQFSKAKSLREIENGLRSCEGKLNHLGMTSAPTRSNLSYCNANRTWMVFEEMFHAVLAKCRSLGCGPRKRRFTFKNKLYSLDATLIQVCLSIFDWAHYRKTKGAVKLHLLLDHDGYLPCFANITDGSVHEIHEARALKLKPGSFIVMDRGYNDYELFHTWTRDKVNFVTRMKDNARYRVLETRKTKTNSPIISDEIIEFDSSVSFAKCPVSLRRVVAWDKNTDQEAAFLTNNKTLEPEIVAEIYRDRWEIEKFFRAIKQNFRIKTFVGTSLNAVMIQIWTALIAILLVKYLQYQSSWDWSISNLTALLMMNLFIHKNLFRWLENPFHEEPDPPSEQILLKF